MSNWKEIEAAPKDSNSLILWARLKPGDKDFAVIGNYDPSLGGWVAPLLNGSGNVQLEAKYWMALPPNPA